MTIIEDTRQQKGKHALKLSHFEQNGIKVVRSKLPIGDYANIKDLSTIVDTKKDIQEIVGNVIQDHKRFVEECKLAAESEIQLIVLVENMSGVTCINDLYGWYNWRLKKSPKATTGRQLAKILTSMEYKYGVKFEFCKPEEAGAKVIELLGGE
ncbi:MAG TPA: hypothetical protein DDW34_12930 [Clostridium sp.]|nr:hypothetical protein [Clostridium sp.]